MLLICRNSYFFFVNFCAKFLCYLLSRLVSNELASYLTVSPVG
jgi:hypothetical protein